MKVFTLWHLLPLALPAQDPATLDAFRDQRNRTIPNPVRDVSDADGRSREALRAPLNADPNLSPSELQSAQTSLIRLNDRLNADAERAALQPDPSLGFAPIFLRPFPPRQTSPRLPADSPNLALTKPTRQSSIRYFPSRGGVDGRVTGTFGFYTELQANPWWDVDLQQSPKITEIRVYNSKINPERARTLQILLSNDGVIWKPVYIHNGSVFGANGQPLRVPLNSVPARWVRLQLAESNYLHLDEIEVYGSAGNH